MRKFATWILLFLGQGAILAVAAVCIATFFGTDIALRVVFCIFGVSLIPVVLAAFRTSDRAVEQIQQEQFRVKPKTQRLFRRVISALIASACAVLTDFQTSVHTIERIQQEQFRVKPKTQRLFRRVIIALIALACAVLIIALLYGSLTGIFVTFIILFPAFGLAPYIDK